MLTSSDSTTPQEWKQIIHDRLKSAFPDASAITVTIVDAPTGKYSLVLVCDNVDFASKSPVARHRLINKALRLSPSSEDEEDKRTVAAIHALNIDAKTSSE